MPPAVPPPNPLTAEKDSLFFVSLPKSGTVFTWTMLERATGLSIPRFHELEGWGEYTTGYDFAAPHIYACGDYNTQLLRPQEMHHYLKGYIFGAHMQASYHNMRTLKGSGINKITVLLRDPRDSFVSWVHHLRKLGPSARAYHSKIYGIPRAYYEWTLSEQFAYQIRTFLPITVNWVEGWLDYYASSDREIDILFVYYDEIKRDPQRYISKILAYHDVVGGDVSGVAAPAAGELHFRKGLHGQWREDFSPKDQGLAAELMQDRIVRGFEAAAGSHPDVKTMNEHRLSGNYAEAALAAVGVLKQFPNSRSVYEALADIASAAGIDASDLRSAAAATLTKQVEDQFLYRYDLLQTADELAGKIGSRKS
jgi:hypothetical protein